MHKYLLHCTVAALTKQSPSHQLHSDCLCLDNAPAGFNARTLCPPTLHAWEYPSLGRTGIPVPGRWWQRWGRSIKQLWGIRSVDRHAWKRLQRKVAPAWPGLSNLSMPHSCSLYSSFVLSHSIKEQRWLPKGATSSQPAWTQRPLCLAPIFTRLRHCH